MALVGFTVLTNQSVLNATVTLTHNLSATPGSILAWVQAKDVSGTVPIAVVSVLTNVVAICGGIATTVAVDVICKVPHSMEGP